MMSSQDRGNFRAVILFSPLFDRCGVDGATLSQHRMLSIIARELDDAAFVS
jgi:hypothetical protein